MKLSITLLLLALSTSASQAYLGSFEGASNDTNGDPVEPDGYHRHNVAAPGNPGTNGVDAADIYSTYNAGAYNTTNGGPGGTYAFDVNNINAANTGGQWTDLNASGAAPSYYGVNYYVMSHREFGSYTAKDGETFMGLRNDEGIGNPDIDFEYELDTSDLSGVDPGTTGTSVLEWTIWSCPILGSSPTTDNVFHWTFQDSSGNTGFQLGYTEQNAVQYRDSDASGWTTTGYTLDTTDWDAFNVTFDLSNDEWSLSMFDVSTGLDTSLVTDEAFGTNLDDLSTIDWHLEPVETGTKAFFDASTFTVVPEMSTHLLFCLTFGLALPWHYSRHRKVK